MWPHHPEAKPGTYPPLPPFDGDRVDAAEVSPEDQAALTARSVEFINRAVPAAGPTIRKIERPCPTS